MDEVTDIQTIAYDRKRKFIMRRTTKKRKLTLDSTLLITIEENLLSIENVKTTELIGAGMAITNSTLDREKQNEKELDAANKELDHLRHLMKYYQDSTQASVFLKIEFREACAQFMSKRHLFTTYVADFQEDTLMELETVKTWRDGMKNHTMMWNESIISVQYRRAETQRSMASEC
jgi:hypothetical protein